jgi:hypothetical protein
MTASIGTFQQRFRQLKTSLEHPDSIRYILHTSLGPLTIVRMAGYAALDITIISGKDQEDDLKTYVFNESQLASYPIELVLEDKTKNAAIGFAAGQKVDVIQS